MKFYQINFIKLIFAFGLFFCSSNLLICGKNTSNHDYQIEANTGKNLSEQKNEGENQISKREDNPEEAGRKAETFSKFRSMLLTSIPDNEKVEMKAELEKMSKDKDFLDGLTPEKLEQIKKDIGNYKTQIQNETLNLGKKKAIAANKKDAKKLVIQDGKPPHASPDKSSLNEQNNKIKGSDVDEKGITFNFPNVSLQEFSRFIAEMNKKILIGSNLLQGNVTIKTPKELNLKRLMAVFKSLLHSHGLDYMISGDYLQIFQKSDSDIKVYEINYLKSADVAKTLSNIFKMSFNVGGVPQRIMINSI